MMKCYFCHVPATDEVRFAGRTFLCCGYHARDMWAELGVAS